MTSVRRRTVQDEYLVCRICNYVLHDPRTLPCQHSFCLKCVQFCVNASDTPTGLHCPVCRRFYDTSRTDSRKDWISRLERNLMLEQLLSSIEILKQDIEHHTCTQTTEIPTTASHVAHLLQLWKSVINVTSFLIKEEQRKLDLLNKGRKSAQIAIRKTCIEVWNLMKRDASGNDWNNLTSREQTLIKEVESICNTQIRLIDERISQEKELMNMAEENTEKIASKSDDEIVSESHQMINDYWQLMDNGSSLLLYTTAHCVKLSFIPDTAPIIKLALGHLLVTDDDTIDHCNEAIHRESSKKDQDHCNEAINRESSKKDQGHCNEAIHEESRKKDQDHCNEAIQHESSKKDQEHCDEPIQHESSKDEYVTTRYKIENKHSCSSSSELQTISVGEVAEGHDNSKVREEQSLSTDTEISDEAESKQVKQVIEDDKQEKQTFTNTELSVELQINTCDQLNKQHECKMEEDLHSTNNTEQSNQSQSTNAEEFTEDSNKVKEKQSYSSSATQVNRVKMLSGIHSPDEGYKTDASEHSSDSNISTRLPVSSLKSVSETLSVAPITSYSSSTKLWWNMDESSATKVHIDLHDPNPGDLELFCVSNTCVVVLVDPHNKSIKSFPDPDTCHRIELNHSPVRIAKINEGKCAVTCKSSSFICLLDVTPALELTRCIKTRKPYYSLSYLPVASEFVCCEAKHPQTLDILNLNGQLIRTIDLPIIDDVRCEPYNVMVTVLDNILMCDIMSRALVCVSQSGDVIFTYKPEGILLPVGVCSDAQGNVFLADAKEHRVILLSEKGNMVGHVISQKDGLMEPWALRYDENRRRFCVIVKRSEFKWFDQTVLDFGKFQLEN